MITNDLNLNDIKIMKGFLKNVDLKEQYCVLKGVSVADLIENTGFSHTKIRNTLRRFVKSEYAKEALRKGNAKTYILTEKAFNAIKELGKQN